jgi:hypothetical protein
MILVTIAGKRYFGMIVHVESVTVNVASETTDISDSNIELRFEIHTTISIYVSQKCSEAIQTYQQTTKDETLSITKLTNITSTRRMISAIHELHSWSQKHSLLKPSAEDPYFQTPDQYESNVIKEHNNFNLAQSKAIAIAEYMYDDMQERMHLVHGPPGLFVCFTLELVLQFFSSISSKELVRAGPLLASS